jgi:hypothetical protein
MARQRRRAAPQAKVKSQSLADENRFDPRVKWLHSRERPADVPKWQTQRTVARNVDLSCLIIYDSISKSFGRMSRRRRNVGAPAGIRLRSLRLCARHHLWCSQVSRARLQSRPSWTWRIRLSVPSFGNKLRDCRAIDCAAVFSILHARRT